MRRRGRASPCDAVRLLDEHDGHTERQCNARGRCEIRRIHAAAGPVTEHECRACIGRSVDVRSCAAERRVDFERVHKDDAATQISPGEVAP